MCLWRAAVHANCDPSFGPCGDVDSAQTTNPRPRRRGAPPGCTKHDSAVIRHDCCGPDAGWRLCSPLADVSTTTACKISGNDERTSHVSASRPRQQQIASLLSSFSPPPRSSRRSVVFSAPPSLFCSVSPDIWFKRGPSYHGPPSPLSSSPTAAPSRWGGFPFSHSPDCTRTPFIFLSLCLSVLLPSLRLLQSYWGNSAREASCSGILPAAFMVLI